MTAKPEEQYNVPEFHGPFTATGTGCNGTPFTDFLGAASEDHPAGREDRQTDGSKVHSGFVQYKNLSTLFLTLVLVPCLRGLPSRQSQGFSVL